MSTHSRSSINSIIHEHSCKILHINSMIHELSCKILNMEDLMSACVLLNEWGGEAIKLSILLLFNDDFNKFNNIGAQILDNIYHMVIKLL